MTINFFRNPTRLVLLSLIILGSSSCTKEKLYLAKDFAFPAKLFPIQETYSVGDTINLVVEFNKILEDRDKSVKYLFENYNFDTSIRIVQLSDKSQPLSFQPGSILTFEFLNQVGGVFPFGNSGGELKLEFTGEGYISSTKIILKKAGTFSISCLISQTGSAELIDPPMGYDKIIPGVGSTFFIINNGEGLNLNLITENTASNLENPSQDDWARPFFAFRVEN